MFPESATPIVFLIRSVWSNYQFTFANGVDKVIKYYEKSMMMTGPNYAYVKLGGQSKLGASAVISMGIDSREKFTSLERIEQIKLCSENGLET